MSALEVRVVRGNFCRNGEDALFESVRLGTESVAMFTRRLLLRCIHDDGPHTWICAHRFHNKSVVPQLPQARKWVRRVATQVLEEHEDLVSELRECRTRLAAFPASVFYEIYWPLIMATPEFSDDVQAYLDDGPSLQSAQDAAESGILRHVCPEHREADVDLWIYHELLHGPKNGAPVAGSNLGLYGHRLVTTVIHGLERHAVPQELISMLLKHMYNVC